MKNTILLCFLLFSVNLIGQNFNEKNRYLLWTFHTQNTTIHGISLGAIPQFNDKQRFVKTNGIRLEVPGIGFLAFIANASLIPKQDADEKVNGINLSSGTIGNIAYNGVSLGLVVQTATKLNGIAVAGMWNAIRKSNGIQATILLNESEVSNGIQIALSNYTEVMRGLQIGGYNYAGDKMRGLQIGLVNSSADTRGIQIGLWNINEKRKFPIINWNFKK